MFDFSPPESPEAASTSDEPPTTSAVSLLAPIPSTNSTILFKNHTPLTRLVHDERAIARLLETMIERADLTVRDVAKALGVTDEAVRQYVRGRRKNPSLMWFLRLAELTGCSVTLEHK